MKLSIVTNDLNDHAETKATLRSILETAPAKELEIVVMDDMSEVPLEIGEADFDDLASANQTLIQHRGERRLGCGGSRHLGAKIATGDYLLFIDCHMRFKPGWYEAAEERLTRPGRERTMHCAVCLGLDEGQMDPLKSQALYTGATFNFFGPDPNIPKIDGKPVAMQVFEGIWKDHIDPAQSGKKVPLSDVEIPCVMGACYFIPRKFFFEIGGLGALREWGSDEPYLSLKTWLAGGEIRLLETVQIGHKFRAQQPYQVRIASVVYNKIRSIMTTVSEKEAVFLVSRIEQNNFLREAMVEIMADQPAIKAERDFNWKMFVRDLRWLCDKFAIPYPLGA